MSQRDRTPEPRLWRTDSMEPWSTCSGITVRNRYCRNHSRKDIKENYINKQIRFFCYWHTSQASKSIPFLDLDVSRTDALKSSKPSLPVLPGALVVDVTQSQTPKFLDDQVPYLVTGAQASKEDDHAYPTAVSSTQKTAHREGYIRPDRWRTALDVPKVKHERSTSAPPADNPRVRLEIEDCSGDPVPSDELPDQDAGDRAPCLVSLVEHKCNDPEERPTGYHHKRADSMSPLKMRKDKVEIESPCKTGPTIKHAETVCRLCLPRCKNPREVKIRATRDDDLTLHDEHDRSAEKKAYDVNIKEAAGEEDKESEKEVEDDVFNREGGTIRSAVKSAKVTWRSLTTPQASLIVIDAIKASRIHDGQLQYQVHWSDQVFDDAWHNADILKPIPQVVKRFHYDFPEAAGPPQRLINWLAVGKNDVAADHPDDNKPYCSVTEVMPAAGPTEQNASSKQTPAYGIHGTSGLNPFQDINNAVQRMRYTSVTDTLLNIDASSAHDKHEKWSQFKEKYNRLGKSSRYLLDRIDNIVDVIQGLLGHYRKARTAARRRLTCMNGVIDALRQLAEVHSTFDEVMTLVGMNSSIDDLRELLKKDKLVGTAPRRLVYCVDRMCKNLRELFEAYYSFDEPSRDLAGRLNDINDSVTRLEDWLHDYSACESPQEVVMNEIGRMIGDLRELLTDYWNLRFTSAAFFEKIHSTVDELDTLNQSLGLVDTPSKKPRDWVDPRLGILEGLAEMFLSNLTPSDAESNRNRTDNRDFASSIEVASASRNGKEHVSLFELRGSVEHPEAPDQTNRASNTTVFIRRTPLRADDTPSNATQDSKPHFERPMMMGERTVSAPSVSTPSMSHRRPVSTFRRAITDSPPNLMDAELRLTRLGLIWSSMPHNVPVDTGVMLFNLITQNGGSPNGAADKGFMYIFTDQIWDEKDPPTPPSDDSLSSTALFPGSDEEILIKIGYSVNVRQRLTEWTRQCDRKITLLHSYPTLSSRKGSARKRKPPVFKMLDPEDAWLTITKLTQDDHIKLIPDIRLVEKLIRTELRAPHVIRPGCVCKEVHEEWFQIENSWQALRSVEEVVRSWVDWAQHSLRVP